MQDMAKLNGLAEAEIDGLMADGIIPTPAEIVELNALAWAVESPESRRLLSRGIPIECGCAYLWPLTLYGQEWFDRVGCRLSNPTAALAYAMAKQYDDGEPLALDGRAAEKAVKAFGRALRCTVAQLNVAISQVLQQEEEADTPPSQSGGMSIGDFSAFLASVAGSTPEFWERRCSAGYTHAVLDAVTRQNTAEGRASSSDPRIRAERALGWAVEKIRQSRKAE